MGLPAAQQQPGHQTNGHGHTQRRANVFTSKRFNVAGTTSRFVGQIVGSARQLGKGVNRQCGSGFGNRFCGGLGGRIRNCGRRSHRSTEELG